MRGRAKNTFPLFELALVVALVFIGWAFSLHQIVPEADENRKQLTQFCGNYRRSADYVRSSINELHDALNGFLQSTTKLQREQFKSDFEAKTKQWRQWVKDENQLWNETQTQS